MAAQIETVQPKSESTAPHWNVVRRVAFRFCFVYFGLYCLTTQIIVGLIPAPIPNVDDLDPAAWWPIRQTVFWAAAHIFHAPLPLVYTGSGSGDKTFDWVLTFCLLILAIAATGIWSVLDRKRGDYSSLYKWFRLFVRFALASEMILYGMSKAIPLQMPFPSLTRLLEPFGNFSPMGVLWYSVGASPAYEMFAGCAEMLAGILLIVPRSTMLGALMCLLDMIQVFMLNMTYDVPVKLFSLHLILMAAFLIAPEFSRLADFFLRNRVTGLSTEPKLFNTRGGNRFALAAQIIFGICLVGANAYGGWGTWHTYGGGRPKSPLYGIWDVNQMSIDGQIRSPLLTDYDRWRRAIFDFPTMVSFQRMDSSFAGYGASFNVNDRTMVLTKNGDKNWRANFRFHRVGPDRVMLDGKMSIHDVHMELQQVDLNKFLLVSRGFHWIQEYPYNR
jgi:uncharacterized membrane protein YphA (DoxX/SURF4 family)